MACSAEASRVESALVAEEITEALETRSAAFGQLARRGLLRDAVAVLFKYSSLAPRRRARGVSCTLSWTRSRCAPACVATSASVRERPRLCVYDSGGACHVVCDVRTRKSPGVGVVPVSWDRVEQGREREKKKRKKKKGAWGPMASLVPWVGPQIDSRAVAGGAR